MSIMNIFNTTRGRQMWPSFSATMSNDLAATMDRAMMDNGIVNIPVLAEQIRRRNTEDNVALEDIEQALIRYAQNRSAAMEFDGAHD